MKCATILLVGMMGIGMVGVTQAGAVSTLAHKSDKKNESGPITKGMTLQDAEQAANAQATVVGTPNNGVQQYRLTYKQFGADGSSDQHPKITFYVLGVNDKGVIVWVHKQK